MLRPEAVLVAAISWTMTLCVSNGLPLPFWVLCKDLHNSHYAHLRIVRRC